MDRESATMVGKPKRTTLDADDMRTIFYAMVALVRATGIISLELDDQFVDPDTGEELPEDEGGVLSQSWGSTEDRQYSHTEAKAAAGALHELLWRNGIYWRR